MQTAVVVTKDTLRAHRINKLHREVLQAELTAKDKAAQIGEMLIEEKGKLKHGEFLPWIEENCEFSRIRAAEYQKVAKLKCTDRRTFDACSSINEVLNLGKAPKPIKAEPATPPEKEMLRKLKVLAEQGATEGERAAAQRKLDRYTTEFKIKPESLDEPCSSVGLSRRDMKVQIAKTLLSNADKKLALNYIMFFIDMAYESDEDIERKLNEIKEKF